MGMRPRRRNSPSRALAPTALAVVSEPVEGEEIYRRDETIEAAVTFGDRVLVDTSLGKPTLGLGVGSSNANRQATYVRGSGTNRLVFEYTVQRTDSDGNGIEFPANALALNGATIVGDYGVEALLTYAAHGAQTGHKVGGSRENPVQLTGGHLRSHAPGARQAGGAGQGEATATARQRTALEVDPENAESSGGADGDAGPGRSGGLGPERQPLDRPQGRRLRGLDRHHASRGCD